MTVTFPLDTSEIVEYTNAISATKKKVAKAEENINKLMSDSCVILTFGDDETPPTLGEDAEEFIKNLESNSVPLYMVHAYDYFYVPSLMLYDRKDDRHLVFFIHSAWLYKGEEPNFPYVELSGIYEVAGATALETRRMSSVFRIYLDFNNNYISTPYIYYNSDDMILIDIGSFPYTLVSASQARKKYSLMFTTLK